MLKSSLETAISTIDLVALAGDFANPVVKP
jgi:hypothetical protein